LINGVLHIERAIGQYAGLTWEKDTKSDADRRIVLDRETVLLLSEHRERCVLRARAIGVELADNAFVFSRHPAGATHLRPDGLTQRYARLATRVGIRTSIHKLRAYNATELIAAGVDIRTVAGRLGHGSGGATTLRSYTAWVSEADQRAAGELAARMPTRPRSATRPVHVEIDARYPFEKLAVGLRDRIYAGEFAAGLPIPSVKQLARQHTVSTSTAQRAVKLLSQWGLVRVERGRPTLVAPLAMRAADVSVADRTQSDVVDDLPTNRALEPEPEALDLEVRHLGEALTVLSTVADPTDSNQLRQLLVDAIRRAGGDDAAMGDYELVVRYAGERGIVTTFVVAAAPHPPLRSVDSSSA
jgi:integrase